MILLFILLLIYVRFLRVNKRVNQSMN